MHLPKIALPGCHRWRRLPLLALTAGLALLAGCAAPPSPRWHTLLPSLLAPGPGAVVSAGPAITASLAPVVVPLQVDQPQWLVRRPDQSLALLDNERWASPLREELRAALRDRLARQWAVADGPAPSWRIDVEVLRFESLPGQATWLEARWTLTPPRSGPGGTAPAATRACQVVLREAVADGSTALADGHRRGVARLADLIGQQLRSGGAGCPAGSGGR